ncbi:MAG: cytokinin riboside 5'-monophosphate phosphoribohydrolase [Acidobacteriota bacterium]
MRAVAVFCGSRLGARRAYREAAAGFGRVLARRGLTLVYGGGNVGLMGVVADAALAEGGEVIGVIPAFLMDREVGHAGLSRLVRVESMHERKATMAGLSDAFVALPGGLGTLEEIFEVWTWNLLGLHAKPCGLLDVDGYFSPLVDFLDRTVEAEFVSREHRELLAVESDPGVLLDRLAAAPPPPPAKWVEPGTADLERT